MVNEQYLIYNKLLQNTQKNERMKKLQSKKKTHLLLDNLYNYSVEVRTTMPWVCKALLLFLKWVIIDYRFNAINIGYDYVGVLVIKDRINKKIS